MRARWILFLGLFILKLPVFSQALDKNKAYQDFSLEVNSKIMIVSNVYALDSIRVFANDKAETISYEFLNSCELFILIPEKLFDSRSMKVRVYKPKIYSFKSDIQIKSFTSYFDYFKSYEPHLFRMTLLVGGILLLLLLSLFVALIARISILFFYNFLASCVLIFILIQVNFALLERFFSVESLTVFMLWMLILVAHLLHNQLKNYDFQTPSWVFLNKSVLIAISFLLIGQLFFELGIMLTIIEVVLLSLYYGYLYVFLISNLNGFKMEFRNLIKIGLPLFWLGWLVLSFSGNRVAIEITDFLLFTFLLICAYFLSVQIIEELNRNKELNNENLQMEMTLSRIQINSSELERKHMMSELKSDVLDGVWQLVGDLNSSTIEKGEIINKSSDILKSLRDYSYTLFPPYIDQLSLENVLLRELEKWGDESVGAFEVNCNNELPIFQHKVFRLWVYRIFVDFLRLVKKANGPLSVNIDFLTGTDLWYFEIVYHSNVNPELLKSAAKQMNLDTYLRYMNAEFSFVMEADKNGWRFTSNVSEFNGSI